ncbi:MAG: PmoA family protein [Puniceicoccaceae bacterium]
MRALATLLIALVIPAAAFAGSFEIEEKADAVVIKSDGKLVTRYLFKERRPVFFPFIGPAGQSMTREWPLNPDSGKPESTDHVHHAGIWFAHGDVRNTPEEKFSDYWHKTTIEHIGFVDFENNAKKDKFIAQNRWIGNDGKAQARDRRTVSFGKKDGVLWLDFTIRIIAMKNKQVILGDTKEGTFSIRVPESMTIETNSKELRHLSKGNIITSEGVTGKESWGKRGKWCAYTGPVEGKDTVIAMFDHPDNPRHPTWWMARHYGLFGANPFGISYFEEKERGTGDMVIPAGESVTFRWRMVFLDGAFDEKVVEKYYKAFAK